ncbi:MAG TPA: GDSL-type esterase/lipase family protein [Geminicoccaceae bacterium]|nr:GDSL-type esterase/lipase family protein [Geminicoccaceae bacterium]
MMGRRLLLPAAVASTWIGLTASCASAEQPERTFYLALGASDAAGIGAEPVTEGYVFRIQEALAERVGEVPFANLGLPGAGVDAIAESLDAFLETRARPDVVTLWTGGNDLIRGDDPAAFEAELARVLGRLRAETDALVVMANVPDLTRLPRFRAFRDPGPAREVALARIAAFNGAIRRQAERFDVVLVDLFAYPIEDELISGVDGFHPSSEGHRRIAEVFLAEILPALGA